MRADFFLAYCSYYACTSIGHARKKKAESFALSAFLCNFAREKVRKDESNNDSREDIPAPAEKAGTT